MLSGLEQKMALGRLINATGADRAYRRHLGPSGAGRLSGSWHVTYAPLDVLAKADRNGNGLIEACRLRG
jgi:hypothetical protein